MKKIRKGKLSHAYGPELGTEKMVILPRAVCRFSTIPTKIPMQFFFTEIERAMYSFNKSTNNQTKQNKSNKQAKKR